MSAAKKTHGHTSALFKQSVNYLISAYHNSKTMVPISTKSSYIIIILMSSYSILHTRLAMPDYLHTKFEIVPEIRVSETRWMFFVFFFLIATNNKNIRNYCTFLCTNFNEISRGCHSCTFCTTNCNHSQNQSQESSIKKPASQRTSSVGESSLGQQPTCCANTKINTNVVNKVIWFSLWERITC